MKNLKQATKLFSISFCIILIIGTSTYLFSQNEVSTNVSEFLLVVETADNEVKLTCKKGCAWKQLSFTPSITKEPQAIDQYGMTTLPRNEFKENSELSNFLFTLKKTEDGLNLEGKEGTAWINLSFECPGSKCYQAVDQYGMTTLK